MESVKKIEVIPADEARFMVQIVEVQRDGLIVELNNAQLENFRLKKVIAELQGKIKLLTPAEDKKELVNGS